MMKTNIIGSSFVGERKQITLVGPVAKALDISPGDLVVFHQTEEGKICIEVSKHDFKHHLTGQT